MQNKYLTMIESKLSLKALYEEKKDAHTKFREDIMELLGCSRETFFIRIKNDSWTSPEKTLISQHLDIDIEILFPLNQESHA